MQLAFSVAEKLGHCRTTRLSHRRLALNTVLEILARAPVRLQSQSALLGDAAADRLQVEARDIVRDRDGELHRKCQRRDGNDRGKSPMAASDKLIGDVAKRKIDFDQYKRWRAQFHNSSLPRGGGFRRHLVGVDLEARRACRGRIR